MRLFGRLTPLGLSGKLLLQFIIATVVLLAVVALSLRHVFKIHFEKNIRPHMIQYFDYVRKDIGVPPRFERAKNLARKLNLDIYITAKGLNWSSNNNKIDLSKINMHDVKIYKNIRYAHVTHNKYPHLLTRYNNMSIMYGVQSLAENKGVIKHYPLFILLVFLLIMYYLIRRLFYPIKTIREGIKHFGDGDLSYRIVVDRKDELGQLAGKINLMAIDIQQMLDAKRQLLLAISHELRTPLTRANVALELSEESKYKTQLKQDLRSMENLIEELLETERLSSSHHVLNLENRDIVVLVREVNEYYFSSRNIGLQLPDEPLIANIDRFRMKLLLKNLIQNALNYSSEAVAAPIITLEKTNNIITLTVADSGAGIEPDALEHIFEPFYRADPSRQRETGGVGLGLYLCLMIVKAHKGSIDISSEPDKGTEISVQLPCV